MVVLVLKCVRVHVNILYMYTCAKGCVHMCIGTHVHCKLLECT